MDNNKILSALLEQGKMTFEDIFLELKCGRTECHKAVSDLVGKKWISKKPENKTRGQRKWYELTEEGLIRCNQREISTINETIKRLQKITAGLRSNPSGISKALFNQQINVFHKEFAGKHYTTEKEREVLDKEIDTKMRAIDAPLLDTFRSMHEIVRQEFVEGFKNKELSSTATVIKDGSVYLVTPEDLKGVNLIPLPV